MKMNLENIIAHSEKMCYTLRMGNQRAKRRLTLLLSEGLTLQTKEERRAMLMYVTYSDLIQIGIFVIALVGLIYEIFKGKK